MAARLAGVVEESTDDDVAVDPFALGDDGVSESARRAALRHSSLRVSHLLGSSHEGFFELHVAALEALERARRDVDAGPMDFAGCAAAARDEVGVLAAHEPRDVASLKRLVASVPPRGIDVARHDQPEMPCGSVRPPAKACSTSPRTSCPCLLRQCRHCMCARPKV